MLPNAVKYIKEQLINKGYQADKCEICHKNFNLLKLQKIHKCKRCSRYICAMCGSQKAIIINPEFVESQSKKQAGRPHRICDFCVNEKQLFKQVQQIEQLKWNQHSKTAIKWIHSYEEYKQKQSAQTQKNDYAYYLQQFEHVQDMFADDLHVINKDILEGRTDYVVFNYSLLEFLHHVQQSVPAESARKDMIGLFHALLVRYPNLGYCQGMNYIGVYLLAFTDCKNAFALYEHLIDDILPAHFYQKNGKGTGLIGYQAEWYVIKKIAQDLFAEQGEAGQMIIDFCERMCAQYLLTLMVNSLNANCLFYVWNEMFTTHAFDVFERAVMAVLKINQQLIVEQASNADLKDLIFRNTTYDRLVHMMHALQNTCLGDSYLKMKREAYFQEYMVAFSLQWSQDTPNVVRQLSKITDFSQDEIKALQHGFRDFVDAADAQPPATTAKKRGISQHECLRLIDAFQRQYAQTNKKDFIELAPEQYLHVFAMFIEYEQSVLDFREFVCCLSLLTRGTLQKKIEVFFALFDLHGKHYLSAQEFVVLLETLTLSMQLVRADERLLHAAHAYIEELRAATREDQKVLLSDVFLQLNHPFIQEVSAMQSSLVRRNTCAVVAECLRGMNGGSAQNDRKQ